MQNRSHCRAGTVVLENAEVVVVMPSIDVVMLVVAIVVVDVAVGSVAALVVP